MEQQKKISFVIPCYRSANNVKHVIAEIGETVKTLSAVSYEIIAVNDCSPDETLEVLLDCAKEAPYIKVVDLAKNMGKHAALMAGYSKVTGDIVVGVDDDGQCPLDKLPELLEPLEQGYDITMARYPEKKQSKFKNFGSSVNDRMTCLLLGKPKDLKLSNFYAFKRFICDEILRYQNPYPYVDGLLLRSTSKIKNVDMEERDRLSGGTGYTFSKSLKLWVNGFTAFSVKPLRLATILGFIIAALGFFYALFIIVQKLLKPEVMAGYSSLMAALLFIGGVIMLLLGLIGEYVGRIYISINCSPQYVIRETVNCDTEPCPKSKR